MRKTVTVLFCDLVGSTAFAEQVDAEAARETMARYHAIAQEVIERAQGTVAKYIGDGVMAMFGVPTVGEDDALRAVTCGVELQRQVQELTTQVGARYGVELGMRVGINTGEVVIADEDADIVGDALNTAARLEAACTPGLVLVGEETWRLTRADVSYEPLGPVAVKGKREPVSTFQVIAVAETDEEPTPFVGRTDALTILRETFEAARQQRAPRLATIIGSPGVGKTRLAAEFRRQAATDAIDSVVRCERAGTATFAPIRDLLLDLAAIELDSDAEATVAALDRLVGPTTPDRSRLVELLGGFVGVGSPRSTEDSFYAIRRLLEVIGRRQPIVLVVDDIQWAETSMLDLVEHLAEWVTDAPVFILCLARPEIRTIRPSLAETGGRVAAALPLDGLDPADTSELAARLLGVELLPPELVARLPASTDGNPLFVRELVRMLVDDAVIERRGDGYELTIDIDAIEVPPTIQSLLATRVERLPDDERRLVELASVVGSEFPRGAVAALASDLDGSVVDHLIEQLRRRTLIDSTGTYWGDEPVLRFHHVLIRDAAYRRLLKSTRAGLHLQTADWTSDASANLGAPDDVAVAFHLEQAYHYRSELGPIDDADRAIGRRAADLLRAGAERAMEQDDLAAAGSLAIRALACLEVGDRSHADLLLLACEALLSSGDLEAGTDALEQLRAVTGDRRLAGWAACFEAQLDIFAKPDRLSAASEACERAAEQLLGIGDDGGVAKAHQVRAGALARLGRIGDCEAALDLALTAARAAQDRRRATAVLGAAPPAALWGPSPVARAGGRCLDVIRLLRITSGSSTVDAISTRCQGVIEALRGRFEAARVLLARSRASAEEFGLRHSLLETELYAGIVELMAGDALAAEPHLRLAHAGLGRLGIGADAGQAGAHLARSLLMQDRLDEAEQLARQAASEAGQNRQTTVAAQAVLAEILATRGRHDAGIAAAQAALDAVDGTDLLVDRAGAWASMARVLKTAGDTDGAASARRQAAELNKQKGVEPVDAAADTAPGRTVSRSVVEGQGGFTPNRASRVGNHYLSSYLAGDIEAAFRGLAPDMVREDRRSGFSFPVANREEYIASMRDFAARGGVLGALTNLHSLGDRLVLSRTEMVQGDDYRSAILAVTEVDEHDRTSRLVVFDLDQEGEARTEMDRLYGRQIANEASERGWEWNAIPASDSDRWASFLAADLRFEDRRHTVSFDSAGRDFLIEQVESLSGANGSWGALTPIATRGNRLSLARLEVGYEGGFGGEILNLSRIDHDGRFDLIVLFDLDDREDAVAELDRLHEVETHGGRRAAGTSSATDVVHRLCTAILTRDEPSLAAVLAEDMVRKDSRSGFSFPEVGRAEYIESMWALHDIEDSSLELPFTVLAERGPRLLLMEAGLIRGSGARSFFLMIVRLDDERRIELLVAFDPDDHDAALAELDRLADDDTERAGGLENSCSEAADDAADGNTAAAVVRELLERASPDDLSAYDDLIAADIVRDDRRPGVAAPVMNGRVAMVDMTKAVFDAGLRYRYRGVVAVRGDRLVLGLVDLVSAGGDVVPILAISRSNEDQRLDLFVFFDPDHLASASIELDRLYLEGEGRTHVDVMKPLTDYIAALNRADRIAMAAFATDSLIVDDHRPASIGQVSGEAYRNLIEQLYDDHDDQLRNIITEIHGIEGGVVAFTFDRYLPSDPLPTPTWRLHAVAKLDGGRPVHIELFAEDQRPDARQRFSELSASA